MFAQILIAASVLTTLVPRDIEADPPALAAATRGLVRNAAPTLTYDLAALSSYEVGSESGKPVRLGYAGYDAPGADWPELKVAHATAADIVFDAGEPQVTRDDRR